MNKYLIEYYNIDPNEHFEVVQLANRTHDNWKSNSNEYKLAELDGYFLIHKVNLEDIEDIIVPYNNAWWLYTKASNVKEAIDKFYDVFGKGKFAKTYYVIHKEIRLLAGIKVENDSKEVSDNER